MEDGDELLKGSRSDEKRIDSAMESSGNSTSVNASVVEQNMMV